MLANKIQTPFIRTRIFAKMVAAGMSMVPVNKRKGVHKDKVWISDIFQALIDSDYPLFMDLPSFKEALVMANTEGTLILARCDLCNRESNQARVHNSTTNYLNATFHFVISSTKIYPEENQND